MAMRGSGALRDLLIAFAVVGGILGMLWVYTGNWPPLVIIESGSMMHPDNDVPYGRFGTIDPGDLVFVKSVDDLSEIEFWVDGVDDRGQPKEDATIRYGKPGDVIVFRRNGATAQTPIIHRAMTYVTVVQVSDDVREYDVRWKNGVTLHFGREGIYLPEIGLGTSPTDGYRPVMGGIITKGDNVDTNFRADQHNDAISRIIQVEWVEGKARAEVPWFGLLKLMVGSEFNQQNPPQHWVRVLNAFAPADLWACLAASIAAIILIPLSMDVYRLIRKERERREEEAVREARDRLHAQEAHSGPFASPPGPTPELPPLAQRPTTAPTVHTLTPIAPTTAAGPSPGPAPEPLAAAPRSVTQRTTCPGCRTAFGFERLRYEPTVIACPTCARGGRLPPLEAAPAARAAPAPEPATPAPVAAPAPPPAPAPARAIPASPSAPAPEPPPAPAAAASVAQRTTCPGCRTAFSFERKLHEPTVIACPACARAGKLPPLSPK